MSRLLLLLTLLPPLLWAAAAFALDRAGQRPLAAGSFDAIVVAGCRVMPDGQPSQPLQDRVALAVRLWREGRAPVIVLTGGLGAWPPTEAEAAAAHARGLGVPPEALVLEHASTSTEENARLAAAHTEARRVVVVTDAYHTFRARRVFARHFAEAQAVGSVTRTGPRVRGALREVLAVAWYGLSGRL